MIREPGSELVARLWGSACPAVSSVLAYPEGRAALAAAQRDGRLAGGSYERALEGFEELYEEVVSLGVDEPLARSAGQDAADHGLRGYDAVHLATALELGEEEVVLVTWDTDLAHAAEAAGLGVAGA